MNEIPSIRHQKLVQMQALPLAEKELAFERRFLEWIEIFPNSVVSFSGGKDSTVLLHKIRRIRPNFPAIFMDTGLEFPEIREFVLQHSNVQILKPKMSFLETIEKYGYPVVSKRMAQYIGEVQRTKSPYLKKLRLEGIRKDGTIFPLARISKKWQRLCSAPFKISDHCCHVLKKQPANKISGTPIVGTMAADSDQRKEQYYKYGCNAFDLERPRSAPMSFWLEDDVWNYLATYDVPYCSIYEKGYKRTGCMFCMFGLHLEKRPNRFDLMQTTHPQIYDWCMFGPLKLAEVIKFTYGFVYERTKDERKILQELCL